MSLNATHLGGLWKQTVLEMACPSAELACHKNNTLQNIFLGEFQNLEICLQAVTSLILVLTTKTTRLRPSFSSYRGYSGVSGVALEPNLF